MSESQQLKEKIARLRRELSLAKSDTCRAETLRVIEHLQTQIAEQK
jgi:hypothetical protein